MEALGCGLPGDTGFGIAMVKCVTYRTDTTGLAQLEYFIVVRDMLCNTHASTELSECTRNNVIYYENKNWASVVLPLHS